MESGKKCIQALEDGFKGVILMDLMMPEMDGWATLEMIQNKSLLDGNVVMVLSAKQNIQPTSENLTNLNLHFMRKPFPPHELIAAVTGHCAFIKETEKALSSETNT
ncbi:MAG: response regulator [Chloroflexota bacterium]|nr:response regulator [Chloroflexota bacterium]